MTRVLRELRQEPRVHSALPHCAWCWPCNDRSRLPLGRNSERLWLVSPPWFFRVWSSAPSVGLS